MQRLQSWTSDPFLKPVLSERHLAYLEERAVSRETAAAARLSSLSRFQIERLLSRDLPPKGGGLGIPYLGAGDETWRVRLDDPGNKQGRWRTAKGEPVRPYLPPMIEEKIWRDKTKPITITEGPIKTLASYQAEVLSISLGGVDTGHDVKLWQEKRIIKLHPELLERISWIGRIAIIAFDTNRTTNPSVALGEARLVLALKAAGATPMIAKLPLFEGGEGPDDFIARHGAEAYRKIIASAVLADPTDQLTYIGSLGKTAEASRLCFELLDSLPFQAALHLGGSSLVAQAAHELRRFVGKKEVADKLATFRAKLAIQEADARSHESLEEAIKALNRIHAVVFTGGSGSILWEHNDPERAGRKVVEFMNKGSFFLKYENQSILVEQGAKQKEIPIASYWLKHPARLTYDQIVFSPTQEPIEGCYNLWQGWAYTPAQGNWSLLRDHILENVCGGIQEIYDYVFEWMADAVQRPSDRPGIAVALRGKMGTGKSIFCKEFGALFGAHFLQVSSPRHLLGNFNAHLANCLLLFGDEAFWAGDKASEGVLKALVTEPNLTLERKGKDVVQMPNRIRLMLSSNNEWIVPAGLEERRFLVLDVVETRMQDTEYFKAIIKQQEQGGREAMMYDLMNHKLGGLNLNQLPQTTALLEQKIRSFSPIQRWWYGRLMAGYVVPHRNWTDALPAEEVYLSYLEEARAVGDRHKATQIQLGIELQKLLPTRSRKQVTEDVRDLLGNRLQERKVRWCLYLPELATCQAHFSKILRTPIDWTGEKLLADPSAPQYVAPATPPSDESEESPF